MDMHKLSRRLEKFQYVSFDIFDTLIKRMVAKDEDVFDIVEQLYNQQSKGKLTSFSSMRQDAQAAAQSAISSGEVTLDDIYAYFPNNINMSMKDTLRQLELQTELSVCYPNPDFEDIFKECLHKGKTVIATSDMYLPKTVLREILNRNGYTRIDEIFVSGETKLNKHSGKIYSYICERLCIEPNRLLHIGDSLKSDYLRPKSLGIHSFHYSPTEPIQKSRSADAESLSFSVLQGFIRATCMNSKSYYYRFGYQCIGVLLYGFTRWLLENLQTQQIPQVYFLSREGQLFKRAFDILNTNAQIKSRYLYVSRKSTLLPSVVHTPDIDDIDHLKNVLFTNKFVTYGELLSTLGFEEKDASDIYEQTAVSATDIMEHPTCDAFYERIRDWVIVHAEDQSNCLNKYLIQNHFQGQLAVVDIGWKASMQKALVNLMDAHGFSHEITGYYLGLSKESSKFGNIRAHGYLFEPGHLQINEDKTGAFRGLFETFFMAMHGTTLGYVKKEDTIEQRLAPMEYSEEDIDIIREMQNGALDFIQNLFHNPIISKIPFSPSTAFENLSQMMLHPTRACLRKFRNLHFYDHGYISPILPPISFMELIRDRKRSLKAFLDSPWRIGFLRSILHLNLNYYRLYLYLKSHMASR